MTVKDFLTTIIDCKQAEIRAAKQRRPLEAVQTAAAVADPPRPFWEVLRQPGPGGANIIAEIKRASPSKGDICPDLDPARFAACYQQGGAAALSVLTDGPFFKGSLEDLVQARQTCNLPVLRKEFILDPYQLYEARAAGADAVLLIVRILTPARLLELLEVAAGLGMEALVEIHSADDADVAARCEARLVGINNRNLQSFETHSDTALRLAGRLAPGQVAVAASGIATAADVQRNLRGGIFNFLVGESIVRAPAPAAFIRSLMAGAPEARK